MARIDDIKTEISTDPVKGLNNFQAGYLSTNAVNQNLALINGVGVERYRENVESSTLVRHFDPAEMIALGAGNRADFDVFVRGLYLNNETVYQPFDHFLTMIIAIFGNSSATLTDITAAIKESVSPAQFLGLGVVDYSEMEEAMNQLGWI